jgi:Uma2 family endonuclease
VAERVMEVPTLKRFTVEEYHQLTALGFFQATDEIELIEGQLIYMAAKGTAHEVCLTRLNRILLRLLEDRATIRCQSPVTLESQSEPEPDFAIVLNREDDYLEFHPHPEHVLLLLEISDSSLSYDQDTKLKAYAKSQIQFYWIFNLIESVLEMYSEPYQKPSEEWGYREKRIVLSNEAIALPPFPDLILNLAKIFPPSQTVSRI